jgi:hypothetical protein
LYSVIKNICGFNNVIDCKRFKDSFSFGIKSPVGGYEPECNRRKNIIPNKPPGGFVFGRGANEDQAGVKSGHWTPGGKIIIHRTTEIGKPPNH